MRLKFLVALLLIVSTTNSQLSFQKTFPSIDRYIDSLMKDWNLPGLALGIVYKDQLIYSKGYGFRDLEKKLPVQANTLFPIASNSKLFTATLAAMLAEEGKLNLDKPVRSYLPSLNFNNDDLNAKVTLRDMLSHRTGLPRYDFIWVGNDGSRKDAVSKIVHMKPQLGLREGYIYNNMMYATAGLVMETITGKSWEDLTREKIFLPLEMKASVFDYGEMRKSGNYSLAYFEPDSTRKLFPKKFEAQSNALGPAGAIVSSVDDMSRWMIAQLNGGMYKGKQVISPKAINETMIPNIIAEKISKYDELSNALYALGRTIQTYKGLKITSHTGSIDGFYSGLLFVPAQGIGIFMVHNGEAGGSLRSVMTLQVLDRLLGLSYTPWSQRYMQDYKTARSNAKRAADSINATRVNGTVPSHALSDYAGIYESQLVGAIQIKLVSDTLHLSLRNIQTPLTHFHYDQFITKEAKTDMPKLRLNFLTNDKGEIDRVTIGLGEGLEIFTRKKG